MVNVTSDFIKKYKGLAKEATMEKAMEANNYPEKVGHLKILENKIHAIVESARLLPSQTTCKVCIQIPQKTPDQLNKWILDSSTNSIIRRVNDQMLRSRSKM